MTKIQKWLVLPALGLLIAIPVGIVSAKTIIDKLLPGSAEIAPLSTELQATPTPQDQVGVEGQVGEEEQVGENNQTDEQDQVGENNQTDEQDQVGENNQAGEDSQVDEDGQSGEIDSTNDGDN